MRNEAELLTEISQIKAEKERNFIIRSALQVLHEVREKELIELRREKK
jgi:hypothetical protein